ncbi:MAG: hypothetical protein ACI9SQ_000976 [Rubritalea sp.]|jgi:hypothetical protein
MFSLVSASFVIANPLGGCRKQLLTY